MIKKLIFFTILTSLLLTLSCDKKASSNSKTSNSNANAQVKTGVEPIADAEIAVIEMEQPAFGTIKLELYSNIAPKMVERFKTLAKEGFYNGVTFHRINETVIQGGDPLSKDANPANDGTGQSEKPNVPAEFSDIPYDTAIVGAARSQNINSANSQFFIMLKREPQFDKKYTIFGKVIEGMGNVNTIAGVQPKQGERPIENVKIKSITIQPK